jgi:hypothetical protein
MDWTNCPDVDRAQDSHVVERYDTLCTAKGKWLIERNIDYLGRRR